MAFALTSTVFNNGKEIPSAYTCEGQGALPPLAWSGAPAGSKSFVLIVDDPDAPDPAAPRKVWLHWLVYNLPPTTTAIASSNDPQLPAGTLRGMNDSRRLEYHPPCPPIGRHRYYFRLYALDTMLPDLREPARAQLETAMAGHILGEAVLLGTYQKKGR